MHYPRARRDVRRLSGACALWEMDSELHYHRELSSRSCRDLSVLSSVCADYNNLLRSVFTDRRKEMEERFLALIQQHRMANDGSIESLPYKPKTKRGLRDHLAITYDLSKLPRELQLLLIEYMRDCLSSSAVM